MSSNNNLQLFRFYTQHFLRQSQQTYSQINKFQSQQLIKIDKIQTYEKFKQLMNYLCDQKLLHPTQVKKLINRISPNNIMANNNNQNQGNSKQNNKDDDNNKIKKKKVNFPLSIKQFENIISNSISLSINFNKQKPNSATKTVKIS